MLPNSLAAKQEYMGMRDLRNRGRDMMIKTLGGDIGAFTDYLAEKLSEDANIATFRENIDYLGGSNQLLTEEMKHAAQNMIAWGEELIRLLGERK